MGHIFAHITCTRVKWEDENGEPVEDAIEEHGWIDTRWSLYVLHDSRNDVRPVVDCNESDTETLTDEIQDALEWLEGGYKDNEDGTFYASESHKPYTEPWIYSYALHFVRKFLGPDGWTEKPWHPVRDGGIEL